MRRPLAAIATGALALLATSSSATAAEPILDRADADDLVEVLTDAFEAHGVCYGWDVSISSELGSDLGDDIGSNLGVGVPADDAPCTRWIIFSAYLTYTDESSESQDSARFEVTSNVSGAPIADDLARLGITEERLLGGSDDAAVAEATRALPLLAAERGVVDPLPLAVNAEELPEGDGATGSHGSDWRRAYGAPIAFGVLLALAGLACIVLTLLSPTSFADRIAAMTATPHAYDEERFDDD